jgi:hypothetical protein
VQQRVRLTDAKRRDPAVDGLANGAPVLSEHAVVARRVACQCHTSRVKHHQLRERALDASGRHVIADTLQNLAENDVGQAEALPVEFGVEPIGLAIANVPEIVHPDRGVDDDHGPLLHKPTETSLVEVTVPDDLAAEISDAGLILGVNQQAQRFFHDRSLGSRATASHGPAHQLVIDVDVRSHDV